MYSFQQAFASVFMLMIKQCSYKIKFVQNWFVFVVFELVSVDKRHPVCIYVFNFISNKNLVMNKETISTAPKWHHGTNITTISMLNDNNVKCPASQT